MNKSESVATLMAALCAFQAEVKDIVKDSKGFGYNYASLGDVLTATRPLCAKHGLVLAQHCTNSPENPSVVGLETVVGHVSGEYMSSVLYMLVEPRKGMSHCQSSGTSISYMRRYAACAAFSLVTVDDDASKEQDVIPAKPIAAPARQVAASAATLVEKLFALIEEKRLQENIPKWLEHFKVANLKQLDSHQVQKLIERIQGGE